MKICFLAGANSLHSYRWIKFFVDRGHDVHWVSLYSASIPGISLNAYEGLSYHELSPPLDKPHTPYSPPIANVLRLPGVVKWARQQLRDIDPDLLHVHSVGIYGLVGALSGFHPLVATAWGSDVLVGGQLTIKRPLIKYALKKADLITCDANHMVEAMVRLDADRKKIRVVNFGIDTQRFRPAEKDQTLLKELRIAESPTVISIRNLLPVYNIESLIIAIPSVLKAIPGTKFVIGGSGSEEAKLRELAASLSVTDSIRFTGPIATGDLPRYLTSMDVYVSTSLSDAGLASSTGEAMACGLPVVVTDSGENSLWIKDGEGGFLVPGRSPEALAEKLIRLLMDDGFRRAAGAANRETIMARDDYYQEMAKMESIYEAIARTGKSPLMAQ